MMHISLLNMTHMHSKKNYNETSGIAMFFFIKLLFTLEKYVVLLLDQF